MKRRLPNEDNSGTAAKRTRHMHHSTTTNNNSDGHVNELLQQCLQKVCELQAELAHQNCSDDEDDAEAAGYAACAVEALRYLAAEGLPPDHPVIQGLSQRLLSNQR